MNFHCQRKMWIQIIFNGKFISFAKVDKSRGGLRVTKDQFNVQHCGEHMILGNLETQTSLDNLKLVSVR